MSTISIPNEIKELKLSVLYGGPSCEREISLISGKAVYDSLASLGLDVVLVDAMGDFLQTLKQNHVQMAFIALHGTFGEDGTVQKLLDEAGILYTGCGPKPSEIAFDKSKAQQLFKDGGVSVADFVVFYDRDAALKEIPFKGGMVVKPSKSGSSVGVTLLKGKDGYHEAIELAFKYSDSVIVEQFIHGRELTVGILGDEALPIVEVIAGREFYDFQAKYKDNQTKYEFPAKLSPKQAQLVTEQALLAYQTLGGEVMARVDIILDTNDKPYVLEANTIPGLTAKSLLPKAALAKGIQFDALCVRIIELSMDKTKVVP